MRNQKERPSDRSQEQLTGGAAIGVGIFSLAFGAFGWVQVAAGVSEPARSYGEALLGTILGLFLLIYGMVRTFRKK
ncbi:hypothetical protein [Frondihabitans cladoniiphilus]|uniref:Uncharacterized protein n=1 Tax=Frondihabitans cladoniiphilus TaxID=715785 RepID=A0ABP8VPV1_9MICO